MKIIQEEKLITSIGDLEKIEGGIDEKNMGLVMMMASKNLYSNPIGSFIRELAANAVDANVDADEESPVLIHIYREEDGAYIEVKDNGIGMSPETFKSIYMKWFSSDKRDSDKKIGGWGLGSKSPLAYQDNFEILTRYNGTLYHRVLADATPLPTATTILEESTTEGNGTTIRVAIQEGDEYKVYQECVSQLVYFNNVYVKNEIHYYDNSFKIYESEYFKLRNKDFPYGNEMHICLGQVAYPINWTVLKLERVNIPVALKFNIEDLEVTLSREDLNYTEKVKERIIAKIELVTEILLKKYEEQLQITDLKEFVLLVDDRNKPPLKIQDVEISMTGIKTNMYFKPLNNLKVVKSHINLILSAYDVFKLRAGKADLIYHPVIRQIFSNLENNYRITGNFNFYDTMYLESGTILRRKKLTKEIYVRYARLLGIKTIEKPFRYTTKHLIIEQGASRKIYNFIKYLDNYLNQKLKTYDGIAPEEWKEEYREKQRQLNQEKKDKITYYHSDNSRDTITIEEILSYKLVFVIDKKTTNVIEAAGYLAIYNRSSNGYFRKNTKLLIVNPTSIAKLNKYKSVKPIEDVFKVKSFNNILYKLKTTNIIKEKFEYASNVFNKSTFYNKIYRDIKNYYNIPLETYQNFNGERIPINTYKIFKDRIDNLKTTSQKQLEYEEKVKILLDVLDKVPILQYVKDYTPHNLISEIITKAKVLKFDSKYYKQQ